MSVFSPLKVAAQIRHELATLGERGYPDFVTSRFPEAIPARVPVFSFHDVEGEKLDRQLAYLKRNGYATITPDEYVARGGESRGERLVLLTFDDGHASLWRAAWPVMQAYNARAAAFLLPGEIREADAPRPHGEGPVGDPLITWAEARKMRGGLDLQSHSNTHWIMFTSSRLTGFHSPATRDKRYFIERPILREREGDDFDRRHPLGAPLYEMDSRLGDKLRVIELLAPRESCVAHVTDQGGEKFFSRKGWREELTTVHDRAAAGAVFDTETPEERREAILRQVTLSKTTLEARLPGVKARHFCFPFSIGSRDAALAARDAGFVALYWGAAAPEWAASIEGVVNVTRVKDDYLFRLPGEGRWPLRKALWEKAKRRLNLPAAFHNPPLGPQSRDIAA